MAQHAKFTTGSTLRHVVVMTLTGSLGLSFMFLVDFLALFWISRLGREDLIAAVGFAATIQFFLVSISIGMMIAAVALVSRALGQGDPDRARRIATSAMIYAVAVQGAIAVAGFMLREPLFASRRQTPGPATSDERSPDVGRARDIPPARSSAHPQTGPASAAPSSPVASG